MLTIGQMSRICSVSVKTLHHYDKIGLLRPIRIDQESGYRYYAESQIQTMLLIGRLKRYGFSLADISALLTDEGYLETELRRQQIRLERQSERLSIIIRELKHHIMQLERTGDMMSYQNTYTVQVETAEAQALLTQRNKMSVDEFGTYYGMLYEKVAREQIALNGVVLAIYYCMDFDPADSDIEVGVGVLDEAQATTVLPQRLCATTVHIGPYSGLPDAYGAVATWIALNGYEIDGAPNEIYVKNQFAGLPPEQWETEIFFPVKKK